MRIWQEKKPDIGILVLAGILIFIYMAIIIPKLYHSKELFGWESGHLGQHIPRRIEVSNEVSFVLLILCQLSPPGENRFAALMPPILPSLRI